MSMRHEKVAVKHSAPGSPGQGGPSAPRHMIVDRSCIGVAISRGNSDTPLMDAAEFTIAPDGRRAAVVVADGMGSTNGGEIASKIASRYVAGSFEYVFGSSDALDYPRSLREAIKGANEEIWNAPANGVGRRGMATTVVAAVIADGRLFLGHAGDSRAILFRRGHVRRLTRDHLAAVLDRRMSDVGLKTNPGASDSDVSIAAYHYLGEDRVEAEYRSLPISSGDIIVLATDGVTECLFEDEMWRIVSTNGPTLAAEGIVQRAIANGSMDHCTAIVVKLASVR